MGFALELPQMPHCESVAKDATILSLLASISTFDRGNDIPTVTTYTLSVLRMHVLPTGENEDWQLN
jgi:hypothetical protein